MVYKINEQEPKIKRKKEYDARDYEIMKLRKYICIAGKLLQAL